jgi:predicted RNA-binding Zn-ribbon protein involved in translation (DUF1610 family)
VTAPNAAELPERGDLVACAVETPGSDVPDCASCGEPLDEDGGRDGFACLVCGQLLCRLCAEDHAREAHPIPWQVGAQAQVEAEETASGNLSLLLALVGAVVLAVVIWPEWHRLTELVLSDRRLMAVGLIGLGLSAVNRLLVEPAARWACRTRRGRSWLGGQRPAAAEEAES